MVIGVYPSAIHVRWNLPAWAHARYGSVVGALAIADEPTVFWDGDGSRDLVNAWKTRVGFREGDEPGEWGHASGAGNGTSGRPVRDAVLESLRIDVADTWFTDVVNEFFVKRGGVKTRQQGDVLDKVYSPFAAELGLPPASLPARPASAALARLAIREHRGRLRRELREANSPLVITIGEEARVVLAAVADEVSGPPVLPLARRTMTDTSYGEPGHAVVGSHNATWLALAHPGNRDPYWRELHAAWKRRRQTRR